MLKEYDNWCPEIYRSMFIDRHNNNQIRVAPCCQANSVVESTDGFNFKTSEYLTQLREKFDRNERPTECNACWKVEDLGHKSRRHSAIEFFQLDTIDRSVCLQSIDHSATWACNLACIMCGPQNSSLWAKQQNLNKSELHVLGRQFQKSNNFLEIIDTTQVKKIHFNGGEPMLNDGQIDLLTKLDQQGILSDVFISYNTNGTVMPDNKLLDLWSKARLIKIFFSIDAIGTAFEYIRWPGKWQQTRDNMMDMKNNLPSNVMFGFNSTVGCYNLFEMVDVWNWFEQNISTNREGDASDFCWQFANNFDIKYLPLDIKIQAIDHLKSIAALTGIVEYTKSTVDHAEQSHWMQQLSQLDFSRKTNWKNSLKIGQYIKEESC